MISWDTSELESFVKRAEFTFLTHNHLYSWSEVITGVDVDRPHGTKRFSAVSGNTFRGFHRIDKNNPGASEVFRSYFIKNKNQLIYSLRSIQCQDELDLLSNRIAVEIRPLLTNIHAHQLSAFNKIRKPIDLYIENLVSMAKDISSYRQQLAPFLYLALDKQMMASELIFTNSELRIHSLSRGSSYGDIKSKKTYYSLQTLVEEKAIRIGKKIDRPFHRIYFDLLWFGRYERGMGNLFELNP